MKPIHLIPLSNGAGPLEPGLVALEHLAATLARTFRTPCRIRPETFDLSFALDAGAAPVLFDGDPAAAGARLATWTRGCWA